MRIVIDLQGAQTESRFRGIGRYTLAFAKAVARNRGQHEVLIALNGLFPDTIEFIRDEFASLLPRENIRVWRAPGPICQENPNNETRAKAAEFLREAFLQTLQPDVIHVCSLFEGFIDDAATSIGHFDTKTPISVILYDLIPFLNPDQYFVPNPQYEKYYKRKIEDLKRASFCFAISNFSRQEGTTALPEIKNKIVTISTAIDEHFEPKSITEDTAKKLQTKLNISQPFVLYSGGADQRKNLDRLIEAYANLPTKIRVKHQLVFAGRMPENEVLRLKNLANKFGLHQNELVFTGHVSDKELIQLYNLCTLFVFPSWHEGFGLPALEAMACGAPVIGSNTTSLPEVIGFEDALFDPFNVTSIANKINSALQNENFRAQLRNHGLTRSTKFSWDTTAQTAISAWEKIPYVKRQQQWPASTLNYDKLIGALAPLQKATTVPEQLHLSECVARNQSSGLERQILLDVSELCARDSATGVQRVVRTHLKYLLESPPEGFRIEPVYATQTSPYKYARTFTVKFLGLKSTDYVDTSMTWQRGDIFFGLDMQHHVQLAHAEFYQQLVSEGVTLKFLIHDLLPIQYPELFKDSSVKTTHESWLSMIAKTNGAICVSRATANALQNWLTTNSIQSSPAFQIDWVHNGSDIDNSKPSLGLPNDATKVLETLKEKPTFICVSTIEPRKRQEQILDACDSLWNTNLDINLVLVGQQGWNVEKLANRLRNHPELGKRLFWLNGISDEYLTEVYKSATCLIAASVDEGFGLSLIEAAQQNVPIIARDIAVFHEIAGDSAYYFRGDSPQDLASALKNWLALHRKAQHPKPNHMLWSTWKESTETLKRKLLGAGYRPRQLLVDVSELAQRDAKTGIQRVTRKILEEWLRNPPEGYQVEPIYATTTTSYRYARQFKGQALRSTTYDSAAELIDFAPGDVFVGLDLQPAVQVSQRSFYQSLRHQGVKTYFVVYDLLCVLMPEHFPNGSKERFEQWLDVVTDSDGAMCISASVAKELTTWVEKNIKHTNRSFTVEHFHLGADINDIKAATPANEIDAKILHQMRSNPSITMVATLEPRKAHRQVLDAFDLLWESDTKINLIFVGKKGWMVDDLVARIKQHPKLNKHLFWLEGIDDQSLEEIYGSSSGLIIASYGEGFGLPLIEAAQKKLPIIARDIPVFREIAGEHAFYFQTNDAMGLASTIQNWLKLYKAGDHPKSDPIHWLTWNDSADWLKQAICASPRTDTSH
ncbi:MAG TPA: glycosyltransferase family 1 protein [Pusillimonas sp.]|nr:glycosyltransferase family 1 protein [Pusillimonas sp.]